MPKLKILDLSEIKKRLKGRRLLLVADATGLSYPTVNKLATGEVDNYAFSTIRTMSEYLAGE